MGPGPCVGGELNLKGPGGQALCQAVGPPGVGSGLKMRILEALGGRKPCVGKGWSTERREETSDRRWDRHPGAKRRESRSSSIRGVLVARDRGANRRAQLPPAPSPRACCIFAQAGPPLRSESPSHAGTTAQPRDLWQCPARVFYLFWKALGGSPTTILVVPSCHPTAPSPTLSTALIGPRCSWLPCGRFSQQTVSSAGLLPLCPRPRTVLSERRQLTEESFGEK